MFFNRLHGDIFSEVPKLGQGITGFPVEPAPEFRAPFEGKSIGKATRSDYILSKKQRELLMGGDVESRSKPNKRALEKRDRLPERIQHCIDDVALLYSSQFFTSHMWDEGLVEPQPQSGWAKKIREIKNSDDGEIKLPNDTDEEGDEYYNSPFESPADFWSEFVDVDPTNWKFRNDVFMMNDPVLSREVKLGFEIGSMLRMLKPDLEEGLPGADLIWGFTLAFIGQSHGNVKGLEQHHLEELIDDFETRQQSRQDEANMVKEYEANIGNLTPDDGLTKQGIEDAGITPHQVVAHEVAFHQPTTPADGDLHRRNAMKITNDMKSIVPLREIDQLSQMVASDLETVQRKGASKNASAQVVLKQIWEIETADPKAEENDGNGDEEKSGTDERETDSGVDELDTDDRERAGDDLTSQNIASGIGESHRTVTRLLNLLSSKEDYELLSESPLVKEISNSKERGREWSVTPYGTVLSHTAYERDEDISWIYRFAIGPEEISLHERKLIIEVLDDLEMIESGVPE